MKNLHMALLAFWSSFSWGGRPIPAYPAGRVPQDAPFPYFTFEVMEGAFFSVSVPTSFIWCQAPKDGSYNVQTQRAEILDMVARAIPESGRLLTFEGGSVLLNRNPATFLSYYNPEEEGDESPTAEPVIGGRISCEMRTYIY